MCGGNQTYVQSTLAVPGISSPGGVDDTSRWHQRIFHRDYRPRKTRVPAVRSRCLLLPPAAAARSPVNSRRSLRTRAVGLSQVKQTKEKADYRMVVCFSLAPPVGLEPTTLRQVKLHTCGGSFPFIQSTLAVPGISLPGGGNPDRCDLIAYRLRPLSRRA